VLHPRKIPSNARATHPSAKPLRRHVHVMVGAEVQKWTYQVHAQGIRIRYPEGSPTVHVEFGTLFGVAHYDPFDDHNRLGIAPSLVKAYIQRVLIDGETWSCPDHVGEVLVAGVLVYKDAATAAAENAEIRRAHRAPLREVLLRAEHRWFTVEMLAAMTAQPHRSTVDMICSMLADDIVEASGPLGERGVSFRLRLEHRIRPG